MKLLQLNLACNWGSTGRICEDIGRVAMSHGWESYITYGRYFNDSDSIAYRVSSPFEIKVHHYASRLLDMQGLMSRNATIRFIEYIKKISPDIIHLHNIHGSWINYPVLFKFLESYNSPVVWTLHDCWSFTGHCAIFEHNNCFDWMTGCKKCKFKTEYPPSAVFSRSALNFKDKEKAFLSISDKLTLVPVSHWLEGYLRESFFKNCSIQTIHNGIDISKFRPSESNSQIKKFILGVANAWGQRKGLYDFYKLRSILPEDYDIVLVGLSSNQISDLPNGIKGISRTNSIDELMRLYSSALVLVNLTYSDNYPTVNLEAISCGTPVITYNTGGSPESISSETGIVVPQGDVIGIKNAIAEIESTNNRFTKVQCRNHAVSMFDMNKSYETYFSLYNKLLNRV